MQGIVEFREELVNLLAKSIGGSLSMQFINRCAMTLADLIVEFKIQFIARFRHPGTVQELISNSLKGRDNDDNSFLPRFTQNDAGNFFQALRICDGRAAEFHHFHGAR